MIEKANNNNEEDDSQVDHDGDDDDDNDVSPLMATPTIPEKKPNFFQRLFGKKDTTKNEQELQVDTAGKTKKQIRQEKRALRRLEKERQKEMKEKGLM